MQEIEMGKKIVARRMGLSKCLSSTDRIEVSADEGETVSSETVELVPGGLGSIRLKDGGGQPC
jgi:hypothetical protein